MYNNIISLIGKVYDLQPIVESIETFDMPDGSIRTVRKNVLIQDYYGLKTIEGTNVSFEKALKFIEENRRELIPQIVSLTKTILLVSWEVKQRINSEMYNKLLSGYRTTDDDTKKFDWCIEVLFNLGILTEAKRITYQAIMDETGVLLAVKKEGQESKIRGTMIKGDDDFDENVSQED